MSKTTKENGPENQRVQSQYGDQRKDGIDELGRCRERLSAAESEVATLKAQSRDVAKREADTNERADALSTLERELHEKEAHLSAAKKELDAAKAQAEARLEELRQLEGDLESRARIVREQEIEAQAGFAKRNRESLERLEAEQAKLAEQLQTMRTESLKKMRARVEKEEADRRSAVDSELEKHRRTALETVEKEITGRRDRLEAELKQQQEEWIRKRKAEAAELQSTEQSLAERDAALAEKEKGLILRERRIESQEEILQEDRDGLEQRIAKRVKERVAETLHELQMKKKRVESLREELDRFEKKAAEYEDWRRRFGQKDPEEWTEWVKTLESDRDRLREELANRPTLDERERLLSLEEERRLWEQRRSELARELTELRAREGDWLVAVDELERQRDLKVVAERRREALQAEMEKLREEVSRLRSLYEQPKEREARVGVIEQPRFVDLPNAEVEPQTKETDWLDNIHELCLESGLSFPPRLLRAFHTSLKTSDWTPLTVLGGVSGTGKSELPRLYARFGGLAFEPLSVQPNWDGPQSMFGFFNSVDNRFNATPLLRALVQSQHGPDAEEYENGLKNRLLLVLLDEMNLAHVELYFSDLLSKLELRRGEKEDVTLEVDLGAGLEEYRVPLGRNVLWVGTMNEDETTKTLSDKVLDRANLLGFPRPTQLRRRQEARLADRQPLLSTETWNSWLCQRSDLSDEHIGKYKIVLEEMNRHLERAGRALGHRVWQAVESYMANYPSVRVAVKTGDDPMLSAALRDSFEDALVHKVMPKLRGIESTGKTRSECLDPIGEMLSDRELGLHLRDDFELACSVGYAFVWRSAKYLEAGG